MVLRGHRAVSWTSRAAEFDATLKLPVAIKADGTGALVLTGDVAPQGTTDPKELAALGARVDNQFCWFEPDRAKRFHGKEE